MGWLNSTVAALWSAGYRFNPLALRRTRPEKDPGHLWRRSVHGEIDWANVSTIAGASRQNREIFIAPETALQVSTVWACISVISKDIASSTWQVFREAPNGDRSIDRENSLWRLLNVSPNPEMTAFSFREAMLVSALLWSDGYAEIERDTGGRPVALWPVEPDRVLPRRNDQDELVYEVWNPVSGTIQLPARDMFHIHGPGIDGLVGFNVTWFASLLFGHALQASRFGSSFYANGAHAGQVLEIPDDVGPEAITQMRDAVLAQLRGAGKELGMFIATNGAKLTNMAIEPEKAQFIETQQHLIEEIARWFDVPPHKIGHLLRATFNNIESLGIDYVNKLIPWCERLRQEAQKKLVLAPNIITRIELDWLAEGTAKEKAEADSTLVNAGIMSRNEVRRRRGMNAAGTEMDKFTVQSGMTTIDKVGMEEPAAPPPGGGEDEDMPMDDDEPENRLRLIEAKRKSG